MNKTVFISLLFFAVIQVTLADEFTDLLQDLAVQTACLGMYSSTEAGGDFINHFDDPPDWYTPQMMADRFARMSGTMTRTITFYGVCFDYAQFAWDGIKRLQTVYNNAGMKGSQWYIAIAFNGDPNTIYLYDPVSPDRATRISNGIHLKENSRHPVRTHDNATGHAWIWVQHKNGTWYWIDPTWTDNTGYPWWGIVQNGREVQYYPGPGFSVAANFPRPPTSNETQAEKETRRPNSTYTGNYDPSLSNYQLIGYNYAKGIPIGITIADSMFFEKSLMYISLNFGFPSDDINIEWIYGIAFSVNDYIRIPIGIGANHYIGDSYTSSGSTTTTTNGSTTTTMRYNDSTETKHQFVMEIGIQPIIAERFYLSATYRLKGFSESGFTLGVGLVY